MTTGLKIKDVADASGFSANTLRYYEQIGLLPESVRTPAGYRTYDQRTLDRLAFISRQAIGLHTRGDRRADDRMGRRPVRSDPKSTSATRL